MESKLSLHLKNFNNKVKVLNQTNSKELVLTATEARNIHSDIFVLLTQIAELTELKEKALSDEVITVKMSGGSF